MELEQDRKAKEEAREEETGVEEKKETPLLPIMNTE